MEFTCNSLQDFLRRELKISSDGGGLVASDRGAVAPSRPPLAPSLLYAWPDFNMNLRKSKSCFDRRNFLTWSMEATTITGNMEAYFIKIHRMS